MNKSLPDVVGHNCNPGALEVGAGVLQVKDQSGLHSDTLSQILKGSLKLFELNNVLE
jgi:hypothetical protein